jgi:hypothetical protein
LAVYDGLGKDDGMKSRQTRTIATVSRQTSSATLYGSITCSA